MSEKTKELTPEQIAEQDRQAAASIRFLSQNIRLKANKHNADLLAGYIKQFGLEWTVDNLEFAADRLEDQLEFKTDDEVLTPIALQFEATVQPYPWPMPLTRHYVATLSGKEFAILMKGKFGKEFQKQVDALHFHKSA